MHTKGSHFNYTQRYPRSFAQWKPECIGVDSGCTKAQMINSYDNSVTYVDHFISSVIDQVRDRKRLCSTQLTTVSQLMNASTCTARRVNWHGRRTCRVPMMVWMSDKYLENPANAQAFAQLKKEADMKVPRRHVELCPIPSWVVLAILHRMVRITKTTTGVTSAGKRGSG
ncbi:sulfatase-like hydrolase/transferase [Escherichia coli]